jgi:hypothetical protein
MWLRHYITNSIPALSKSVLLKKNHLLSMLLEITNPHLITSQALSIKESLIYSKDTNIKEKLKILKSSIFNIY